MLGLPGPSAGTPVILGERVFVSSAVEEAGVLLALEIAKTVFRWEGSDAIEEHRDQGYMLTSSGMNLVSWGTVMGAWIEAAGQDDSKVTVVTKRRLSMNIATTLTETTFHKRFKQAVEIVKSGKPLPATAPQEMSGTPAGT